MHVRVCRFDPTTKSMRPGLLDKPPDHCPGPPSPNPTTRHRVRDAGPPPRSRRADTWKHENSSADKHGIGSMDGSLPLAFILERSFNNSLISCNPRLAALLRSIAVRCILTSESIVVCIGPTPARTRCYAKRTGLAGKRPTIATE
ncbi:hypothetical protein BU26DRAFT_276022 [Trematosphaeria pertusa]|uniref:Uncharacterized protein n=1 Tax=Trematosphaeria pertusa TaxID=390896 RepID=A0A6A6ILI7_9PLEO|nr:uncharacterized protein BU26DRAFT_276022 [Trematosphaeria pertusa]KAF2251077.1 hypothetical protein BU26DRAFT_276022 [Trematosphaeria pertusa]